jgi:putative membrane protein
MWWFHGFWGWSALAVMLVLAGFWVFIGLLFADINRHVPEGPPPARRPIAEQILAERFARGEIDEDELWRQLDARHRRRHAGGEMASSGPRR